MAKVEKDIPVYDTSKLKHVETKEKQVLPSSDGKPISRLIDNRVAKFVILGLHLHERVTF